MAQLNKKVREELDDIILCEITNGLHVMYDGKCLNCPNALTAGTTIHMAERWGTLIAAKIAYDGLYIAGCGPVHVRYGNRCLKCNMPYVEFNIPEYPGIRDL